jgi:3-isopropylmalate/(R)-2-methylmalate dehydratase large subunit
MVEKIWNAHVVRKEDSGPELLYVDLHLVHEVSSPQAFDGLRESGLSVRRPDLTLATEDHAVPTIRLDLLNEDTLARDQVGALRRNCEEFGIELFSLGSAGQGIVHVIGPELGLSQPGMLIVCSDSHTSTHGAFGALAFGIGTSEAEHVLATQTIPQARPKLMAVNIEGELAPGVSAKDIILALIAQETSNGGQGYIVEYRGAAVRAMSMEQRMTICNMSIEWGAKAGLIAPDATTFEYIRGRRAAPSGDAWDAAVAEWGGLCSDDDDAVFDRVVELNAALVRPFVTWGTNPGQGVPLDGAVPQPAHMRDDQLRSSAERALEYMALKPGTPM